MSDKTQLYIKSSDTTFEVLEHHHDDDPHPLTVRPASIEHQGRDYRLLFIHHGDTHIQVTVSPTGRSVQVHVDGERVK